MVEARGASDRPFNRPLVQQNIYRRILPGIPLSSEIWICRKMKFERKNELGEGISRMEVDETQEEGEDRFCSEFSEHFYEMSFCKKKKKVLNRLVKIE